MKAVTDFFESIYYPVAYALLALACSFAGFEIAFFAVRAALSVFSIVFCSDTFSLFVPIVLAVYGVSQRHTPQPPYGSDYLYGTGFLVTMGCLLAVVFAAMVFRMVAYRGTGNVFRTRAKLRWGLFALAAALVLNGIFSEGYTAMNLVFGIVMALSFVWFYIFFYNTAQWNGGTAVYIARVLAIAAAVIFIQLTEVYIFDGAVTDGAINKGSLVVGWGMSNNIGGMLAMFMPAFFYLAYRQRFGWLWYLGGFACFGGVVLTLSRTSVLVAAAALVVVMVLLSIKGRHRKFVRIFNIALVAALAVLCIIFSDKLAEIFRYYLDRGFDDSGRFEIWENGWKNFLRAPVFGAGFLTPIAPGWSYNIENWLFPDMYHNTYVQLFACCGVVGVAAYTFHIVQGFILIFRHPTPERIFFFFVIAVLSGISMADNHLFHVFPALVYSALLAACEKDSEAEEARRAASKAQRPDGGLCIREYTSADLSAVSALFYETVHSVNAAHYTSRQLDAWAPGRDALEARKSDFSAQFALVAVDGDRIVGFGSIDGSGCLDMLYVDKDFQRRGIATALCDRLEEGFGQVTAYASVTARPFFEKRGYAVVRRNTAVRRGVPLTNFEMRKVVRGA
mgnify:FL=1